MGLPFVYDRIDSELDELAEADDVVEMDAELAIESRVLFCSDELRPGLWGKQREGDDGSAVFDGLCSDIVAARCRRRV